MKPILYTAPDRLSTWQNLGVIQKYNLECMDERKKIILQSIEKNPFEVMVFIDAEGMNFSDLVTISNELKSAYIVVLDSFSTLASAIIQNHSALNINDYINQVITDECLKNCFKTYKSNVSQISTNRLYGNYILLNDKNERNFVALNDINFIEGFGAYTKIHTNQKTFVVSKTLQRFLDILPDYFIRTHRSYAVHIQNVKYLTKGNTLVMKNGIETKVSRGGIQILMSRMVLAS